MMGGMATFTDPYGVRIHYEAFRVPEPKAVVQLAHGVGEHIGRYTELIDELNAAGYSVWADDHRGHGQTGFEQHGGDLTRMGRPGPGGMRAAIDGVHQFTSVIRAAIGDDVPLVLLGHSWGSFIAQILVNEHPHAYDAVVLSGTAYRSLTHMNGGDLNAKHKHLGDTPVEWLSRDPEVAADFMADPYTTSTPLAKLFGLRDAAKLLGKPAKNLPSGLPVLIMVGDDDSVGGEASAVKLASTYVSRSGLTDVEVMVYAGARHEIFNETNRDQVRADLVNWLDDRFASQS